MTVQTVFRPAILYPSNFRHLVFRMQIFVPHFFLPCFSFRDFTQGSTRLMSRIGTLFGLVPGASLSMARGSGRLNQGQAKATNRLGLGSRVETRNAVGSLFDARIGVSAWESARHSTRDSAWFGFRPESGSGIGSALYQLGYRIEDRLSSKRGFSSLIDSARLDLRFGVGSVLRAGLEAQPDQLISACLEPQLG